MKKLTLTICLLVLIVTNLFPQENTIKVDSGYINVDGGKLFYEVAGKGENIVLLHDGMVHREIWDEQFLLLANNYKVARYDRRNYGKSSDPAAPYSDIEDLNQLFTQLKIDKAIVFGMSSGGGLAIDFTLKYPEKVSGLVLVGAVVGGYGYTSHMTYRGGHLKNPEMMADPAKAAEYFIWDDPYEMYAENREAKQRIASILKDNLHRPFDIRYYTPPERIAARFLSEIKVPCLVLVGEHDIPDVYAHAGVIHYGIPGARREIILKSGHLVPIEQPEAFNTSVLKFTYSIEFYRILKTQGVDAAAQFFKTKYDNEPNISFIRELEMNALGYRFLQDGKIKDAIELFKLNTIAFPKSGNAFDSLGEAYLNDGQKDLAIKSYEKSLELDPGNENAKKVLKELKGTK